MVCVAGIVAVNAAKSYMPQKRAIDPNGRPIDNA